MSHTLILKTSKGVNNTYLPEFKFFNTETGEEVRGIVGVEIGMHAFNQIPTVKLEIIPDFMHIDIKELKEFTIPTIKTSETITCEFKGLPNEG
jgi:hypothetical protein